MTAIGMILDGRRAVVWADTQAFRDDIPSFLTCKLMVNPTGRLVGCGTGWSNLLARADHAVTAAMGIDDLVRELPPFLRLQAAHAAERRADPATFGENAYVVAGWSEQYRRLIGFTFLAGDYFTPVMVRTFASPAVGGIEAMDGSDEELRGAVVEQIAALERGYHCRIGGRVLAATIGPHEVAARCLVDLALEGARRSEVRAAALQTPHD